MLARAHVWVTGLVQGVFFRYETQRNARIYGVMGWVRNLPDHRVEAVFEGERDMVEKIIEFCRHGPPGAKVTNIEVIWEEPKDDFTDFKIVR